jgi:FkbM family methyltransferase
MATIKKVKVQYCGEDYELYAMSNDDRTNVIAGRKGTQEGKVCTWKDIVTKLKAQRVFDIGCNYGEFLIPISNINRHIYAFEPINDVYKSLVKSINELSYETEHISLINAAIGDTTRESILNIPASSGNASLDINCVKYKDTVKPQLVEEHDILYYIEDCNNFIMKLDIEGTEHKVLSRIKQNDNFDWYCIMFEFTIIDIYNRFNASNVEALEEFMDGKKVMGISNDKLKLSNDNFFLYEKGKSFHKLKNAHDVIVCKNVDWDKV